MTTNTDATTRTTGATDEQIVDAAECYASEFGGDWDMNVSSSYEWAACLVPPDMVITEDARQITDDEIAALDRIRSVHEQAKRESIWRSVDHEMACKSERTAGDGPSQAELDRWERQATDRWSIEHPSHTNDREMLDALLERVKR